MTDATLPDALLADATLVRALVNTRGILADDPYAREEIADPAALRRWWSAQGLTVRSPTSQDVADAHTVREGLRALLARHNDAAAPGDAAALEALDALCADLLLRSAPTAPGPTTLRPASPARSAAAALGWVLVAVEVARAAGAWERLKVCADPDCREAYLDTTRNRSRHWCSMQVCGARAKQRTFADRHRPS